MRSDGALPIELTSRGMFRIGDHNYTTGDLEAALQRLSRSPEFKSVELYIPSKIAHQPGFWFCSASIAQRV
jgi:hypothetical protein